MSLAGTRPLSPDSWRFGAREEQRRFLLRPLAFRSASSSRRHLRHLHVPFVVWSVRIPVPVVVGCDVVILRMEHTKQIGVAFRHPPYSYVRTYVRAPSTVRLYCTEPSPSHSQSHLSSHSHAVLQSCTCICLSSLLCSLLFLCESGFGIMTLLTRIMIFVILHTS